MKKYIAILLCLIPVLTVVGCGKKTEAGKLIGIFHDIPKPDELTGRYQDIIDYRGAVVGTAYVDATNEIKIDITTNDNGLAVQTSFVDPQQEPYVYVDRLGIAEYQIIDSNGRTVKEGSAKSCEIVNGQTTILVDKDGIESGAYNLIISSFVAESKAEQPLNISGKWDSSFSI